MVWPVTIIVDQMGRFLNEKGNSGGQCKSSCLVHCQMTVAYYGLVLWKADKVQQHKLQLFPRVIDQPLLVFLYSASKNASAFWKNLFMAGWKAGSEISWCLENACRRRILASHIVLPVLERSLFFRHRVYQWWNKHFLNTLWVCYLEIP